MARLMRWVLLVLLLVSTPVWPQTNEECLRYAVWKEARGESKRTMRAVMDVINNRQAKYGLSACSVLRQPSQFPYFKRGVKKVVDYRFDIKYNSVVAMNPVLPPSYLYFNHYKHPWGTDTKKLGRLYFSK